MSAPRLVAVLPPAIRRRWDTLALEQLCELAPRLETENDSLREQLARAEDDAEHWRENALELAGDEPGLTIEGRLVRT